MFFSNTINDSSMSQQELKPARSPIYKRSSDELRTNDNLTINFSLFAHKKYHNVRKNKHYNKVSISKQDTKGEGKVKS